MSHIKNRAAEYGGIILTGSVSKSFNKNNMPVAIKVIEDVTISTIDSPDMIGIGFYEGKAVEKGDVIIANISQVTISGGTIQLINGEG